MPTPSATLRPAVRPSVRAPGVDKGFPRRVRPGCGRPLPAVITDGAISGAHLGRAPPLDVSPGGVTKCGHGRACAVHTSACSRSPRRFRSSLVAPTRFCDSVSHRGGARRRLRTIPANPAPGTKHVSVFWGNFFRTMKPEVYGHPRARPPRAPIETVHAQSSILKCHKRLSLECRRPSRRCQRYFT